MLRIGIKRGLTLFRNLNQCPWNAFSNENKSGFEKFQRKKRVPVEKNDPLVKKSEEKKEDEIPEEFKEENEKSKEEEIKLSEDDMKKINNEISETMKTLQKKKLDKKVIRRSKSKLLRPHASNKPFKANRKPSPESDLNPKDEGSEANAKSQKEKESPSHSEKHKPSSENPESNSQKEKLKKRFHSSKSNSKTEEEKEEEQRRDEEEDNRNFKRTVGAFGAFAVAYGFYYYYKSYEMTISYSVLGLFSF